MIRSWKHKGLKKFYQTGNKAGIQARHASTLAMLLFQLDSAVTAEDMDTPGNDFHKLLGDLKDCYAVKVSGNWRMVFNFEGNDAYSVNYVDYH